MLIFIGCISYCERFNTEAGQPFSSPFERSRNTHFDFLLHSENSFKFLHGIKKAVLSSTVTNV